MDEESLRKDLDLLNSTFAHAEVAPWWKILLARLFGEPSTQIIITSRAKAFKSDIRTWRGVQYVISVEEIGPHE